jgi:formamidase
MARMLGIAAAQVAPVVSDPDGSLAKLEEVVLAIADTVPWVDLICFPELFVTGQHQFVDSGSAPSMAEMAQPIPGPLTERFCALARRARRWLVPGTFFEREGDAIYNSAVAISPQGEVVAHYRKLYPWLPLEAAAPGNRGFCVWDIPRVGRIGICVCYDMWFPEVARSLAWLGAEVILHPSMTSTSDRGAETVLAQANAIFNQCFFVDVNIVGRYGGGRSQIIDPDGTVLQLATEHESILTRMLDLDHVTRTREHGTLGLARVWQAWRDVPVDFPAYAQPPHESMLLRGLRTDP